MTEGAAAVTFDSLDNEGLLRAAAKECYSTGDDRLAQHFMTTLLYIQRTHVLRLDLRRVNQALRAAAIVMKGAQT